MIDGLDGLHKPQPSAQSRRWAGDGGSTWPTVRVPIKSDRDIVAARQQGRALATAMMFSATDVAFIATTISELARAILSRTNRGEIWLHKISEDERAGLAIMARGPMVSNVEMPDVFRLVDEFDVVSDAGRGTTIRAAKWCRRSSRVAGG